MSDLKSYFAKMVLPILGLSLFLPGSAAVGANMAKGFCNVLVPVYVITDRNLSKYPCAQSLSDPASLSQCIHAGVVRVPVRVKPFQQLDSMSLAAWGCSIESPRHIERISRDSIESQIVNPPGTAVSITPGNLDPLAGLDSFIDHLNEQIAKSSQHELLIFIHGCCEGPQDSIEEAAQLSVQCNSPVLLFDWASPSVRQAGIWTYMQSDRALEVSELYFGNLIERLRQKNLSARVTLVAYSMGSRLIRNYLRQFPESFFDQIHLVRPDISLPVFLIEQYKFKKQFGQMFIYVSAHDLALQSSALLMSSNVERLGMQPDPAHWFAKQLNNAPPNATIIDTSNLHQEYDFIGHRIPFEAVGYIHGLKDERALSLFKIERPFSINPHFWKLRDNNIGL